MKLSPAEVVAIQEATGVANAALIEQAVAAGKYIWQAFGNQDGVGGGPSQSSCASWMSTRCTPDWQSRATTQQMDDKNVNQSIASFLIVRPPIGYLGYGWESDMKNWKSEFLWQVGEPLNNCSQPSSGVFTRDWTYGTVTLDCNTWTATIPTA
jgi:Hypothetical glycosyl hydrolase family 15